LIKILDRYIVREIALPFALSLVAFTFVLEIPPILNQAEPLISRGVEWPIIGRVLLTLLPQALSLTIPVAVLFGILVGLARMSADRELVAMQACGVSLIRLFRPIALLAVLGTAATAYEVMIALPDANQTFRTIAFGLVKERVENNVKPRVFFDEFPNYVIYVQDVRAAGGWRDVFLADTRGDSTTVYFAKEGRILVDREKQLVHLVLTNATSHTTIGSKPETYEGHQSEQFTIVLNPKDIFRDPPNKGVPEMTFAELRAAIADAEKQNRPANIERFFISYKFALPLTCPILALIGLALGATNRKDGRFAGFAVGLGVVLVYYVLLYGARAAAQGGRLSPEWAPWIPNIVMTIAGLVMMGWRSRWADQPLRLQVPAFLTRRFNRTRAAQAPEEPRRVVLVVRVPRLNIPKPRVLDVYLSREYLRVLLLGVASLLAMFYIFTFIDLVDKLLRGDTTTRMLLQYFYFQTPQFVYYVIPMAVLLATLVTIGLLSKNSELMVMRACGISLYRTAAPLIFFALAASAVLYTLQERVLAQTRRDADRLERIIRKWPPQTSPLDRRWVVGADGSMYHYDYFDARSDRFTRLHVYRLDQPSWKLQAITYARDATPAVRTDGEEGATVIWNMRQGWIREMPAAQPGAGEVAVKYAPFETRDVALEPPKYFKSDTPDPDMMKYGELRNFISRLEYSGADVARYEVALQRKIAFPLVTLVMTMLAVPFAVMTGRRGPMYGIGAALVIALVYRTAESVLAAFGAGGLLPPTLAAWAPNLLFGAAAAYLMLTVRT